MTEAAHTAKNHKDGSTHMVGFLDLRVMLLEEDEVWYAQGLEIDYISQGRTKEEAMRTFEEGLAMTIKANLDHCGNVKGLLKPADNEAWTEFFQQDENDQYLFSCVTTHHLDELSDEQPMFARTRLPFNRIAYLSSAQAA